MHFRFEPLRATQAAAVLVKHAGEGNCINYMKLIKLLYLADRKALIDTGSPITGDRVVNMKNGPVLSAVYDSIKGDRRYTSTAWPKHFRKEGFEVRLVADPGDGELSDYDVDTLSELGQRHRHDDPWAMVRFVHRLPEWKLPEDDGGADPLSYEEILRKAGFSEAEVAEYAEQNDAISEVEDAVFSATCS